MTSILAGLDWTTDGVDDCTRIVFVIRVKA